MKKCLLVFLMLLAPILAHAQVAVMPIPVVQFLDNAGAPAVGGQLFTYVAGTNILQATYTDSTGTTMNPDPVILDGAGRASVWVNGQAYKFILEDNFGNVLWVQDNVSVGIFATADNVFTGNNTFSGTTTFSGPIVTSAGGTLNGNFAGNPNFSGTPTFSGGLTFLGAVTFGGTPVFQSGANLGTGTFTGNATLSGDVIFTGTPVFNNAPVFSTGISADLYKGITPGGTLSIQGLAGSTSAGEGISITSGAGDTNFGGGPISLSASAGMGTGAGGAVTISAGTGGTSGNGGAVAISAGNSGGGTTNGGNVVVNSGNGSGVGANGNIVLQPCGTTCGGTGGGGHVVINAGIANNGTGLQHIRITSGCVPLANAVCNMTVTWPSAFNDANYTFVCSPNTSVGGQVIVGTQGTSAPTASSVQITLYNITASNNVSNMVDCIAIHD